MLAYTGPTFNSDGSIDMEIEHPVHGPIPFTASPDDPEEHGRLLFADAQATAAPYVAPLPDVPGLLAQLSDIRKAQEAQGVIINGIRYAGDPGNRQALQEAIEFMNDAGLTEFPKWKDSDNEFHVDHPLADVVEAYRAIGMLRVALIAAEGEYAAQIIAGTLTDLTEVVWP
jgi:hypothetical protein